MATDQINELYQSLLGRAPDQEGYNYWSNRLNSGESLDSIKQAFTTTPEYLAKQNNGGTTQNTYTPMSRDQYMNTYKPIIQQGYNQARNTLREQQAAIEPTYQQQKNNISNQAQMASKRLGELLQTHGIRGGSAITQQGAIQNRMASDINSVDTARSLAQSQLANRLAELDAAEQADLARAALGYEDYAFRAEQLNQDLAALLGSYNGQRTLSGQSLDLDRALQEAALTGTYNGVQTLPAQELKWQQEQAARNYDLDWMKTLLSYNLGFGELTDNVPQPKDFNWGDTLAQLLKRYYPST